MKILHTADWHFDLGNLDQTAGAIDRFIRENHPGLQVDLVANSGDLAVHRGYLHPHVAFTIRNSVENLSMGVGAKTTIVLSGNHDQSFHADRVGTIKGIFGTNKASRIQLVEEIPWTFNMQDGDGLKVAVVCIPTPSKYMLKAGGGIEAEFPNLMTSIIKERILAARAEGGADRVVVMYHGTVTGARAGDEMVMTAGIDLSVPREAFAGADAVLLGHIHKPQVWKPTEVLPPIAYCGSIAPLTWGDKKLKPSMLLWEITAAGVTWKEIPIPVVAQMLHYDLNFAGVEADRLPGNLRSWLAGNLDVVAGTRVRLKVSAPGDALAGVTPALIESLRSENDLRELKVIPDPVDAGIVRMDLEDGWQIQDAFERYMDFMGVAEAERPELRRLCRDVETQVEDKHLDARYDFEPVSMEAENWCQYGKVDVTFDGIGPVVAITGENFAGKSNLSRILLFALYKKQVSGKRLNALVRNGEKDMRVAVKFKSHGQVYEVTRTVRISGSDRVTGDMTLVRIEADGTVIPINEGTAGKTQEALEKLIGPLPLFLNTCFAGQNQIDRLLDLTPSEMKDVLMGVLQRNFEGRLDIVSEAMKDSEKQLAAAEAKRAAWAEVASGKDEIETEYHSIGQDLEDAEVEEAGAARELKEAEAINERAMDEAAKAEAVRVMHSGAVRDLEDARKRLAQAEAKAAEAADAARRAAEIRSTLGEAPDMGLAAEAREAARTALREAEKAKAQDVATAQAVVDQIREELRRISIEVVGARGARDRVQEALAAAHRAAGLLGDVPCQGGQIVRTTASLGPETVDAGACRFLLDATEAAGKIPKLMADLESAKIRLAAIEDDEVQNQEAHAMARDAVAQASQKHDEQIRERTAALLAADDGWAKATAGVEAHRSAAAKLAALDAKAAGAKILAEAVVEAQEQVAGLEAKEARIKAELAGFGDAKARLDSALAVLRAKKDHLEAARAKVKQIGAAAAEAVTKLEQVRKAEAILIESQKEIDRIGAGLRHMEFYRRAMHRDGLPFLLLEKFAIPGMQRLMNTYLSNTPFRVSVTSEKELASGESRNAVNIEFVDHRGTHDKSAASGYQRTAIGMAAMAALADLNAEATGSKIWLTIQDEGFGTMTDTHIDGAKAMIRQVGMRRGWFLFISHVKGMADCADTELEIIDANGVSRVEVR